MPRRNRKQHALAPKAPAPVAVARRATFGPWADHDPMRCKCISCR